MNPLLNYGIQVIIVSGLLYSYYHFVLRNKKFHRYNRFYLLAAAMLSVLIPLLNIPVYFSEAQTESSIVYNTLRVFATTETDEAVTIYAGVPEKASWFTTTHIFQLLYITIAILVLLRIIFSLLKIRRIIRRHPVEKIENIHFLNTDEPGTPFSFFRWLFWNRKIELNSEKGEQIFRHELFHIEQKHSLDIIFLELLTVAGWFNPFFHLMKRETKAIHEFLADQFAVTENNRWDYAELLLMQVLNTNQKLVHPFFHNQIKRRIAMITSPQKTSHQYLRKLMVLPLTILSIFLFAFSYKEIKKEATLTPAPEQKISADTTIKPTQKIATFDKMVIVSDSIIFKSIPSKGQKENLPEAIVFMNGKRVFQNEYAKKTILCDSFEYYSPDDRKAIELYGPEARAGVMIIHNGKITDTEFELKEADKPEADKIFDKVEIEASFPGGSSAWRRYLERNLDASIPEKQKAPAGNYTVIIQFVVNLDGTVSDVRALTNHGYGMETEAIRAIKKGPKWLPAIQNGRKIVAYRKQPITFVVDNGPKKESKLNAGQGTELNEGVVVGYSDPSIPTFPGGDSAWKKYLIVNANSTVPVNNGAPEGIYKTRIRFIVHPDGTLSDITALTHFGYGMEEEAIRVIKNGPRWIPATREGTKVSSYREQPMTFEVTSEPDRPNYPPVIPSIRLTNITSPRLANGNLLKLDPGTIYIGMTNTLLLETSVNDLKYITAESGNGNMLKIENGKIEIQSNTVQDQFAIKLFYTKDNIKTTVKTVNFLVRLVPQQ